MISASFFAFEPGGVPPPATDTVSGRAFARATRSAMSRIGLSFITAQPKFNVPVAAR